MLGKLFKYEFRATGRIFLPAYAALLVMSVVTRLFYGNGGVFVGGANNNSELLAGIATLVMIMLFTAVWVVTLAVTLRRFWTNILGREGYLTNVLPVHPWEHMLSKLGTAAAWNILSGLVSVLALWIMLGEVLNLVSWSEFAEFWREFRRALAEAGTTGQAVLLAVQVVVSALLSLFRFILSVYAAMCVGQLVNTHRIWASIGSYFGVSIAQSLLFSVAVDPQVFTVGIFDPSSIPDDGFFGGSASVAHAVLSHLNQAVLWYIVLELFFCAALFFAGTWILRKRLNLQ